ncbi:unnamed protein product [Staurois parvus]|uniref:Uncharacterized protein n=1 Tax=Staurois parvus TaxID=386267 RepID=A0ABN9GHQ6_9NEOB|nr:unnamed protein product [Staurois parvus]
MTRDCRQYRDDQRLQTLPEMTRDCRHSTGMTRDCRQYRDDQRLRTQYCTDGQRLQTVQG